MEEHLSMAESKIPAFSLQQLAEWDRPPEHTVFSCGSPSTFTMAELKTALTPWLRDARVDISCHLLPLGHRH
eukprot:380436-Pyramimonas_sp.AAC.1